MGQFDLETDAALAQLDFEELSKTPGGEFAEIASDLLKLIGARGPGSIVGGAMGLLQKIRALAGASYASNLIYLVNAVRNDLADLYAEHSELRERIESLPNDPRFAEAIAALALRAMHTSVKDRLNRLARIVVNGVRENDLAPETLDDLMRAAVELSKEDVRVLARVWEAQGKHGLYYPLNEPNGAINRPREVWQELEREGFIRPTDHMSLRSSLAKLESFGFGAEIQTMESSWLPRFLVTPAGEKFLIRQARSPADEPHLEN